MATARHTEPGTDPEDPIQPIRCIGPHQINPIDGSDEVTVTYPVGSDTVLSVDDLMNWTTKPKGTQGPYERALLMPDRLVFAPKGDKGEAFLLPYTDRIPNV